MDIENTAPADTAVEVESAPQQASVKKGKPSWKPATMLDIKNRIPGYRYRWCWIDDMNLQKKEREGWVYVNKETGFPTEHDSPENVKPLDSAKKYRDTVLMALPEELGEARDRYFHKKTQEQSLDAKTRMQQKKDASGNPAQIYEPNRIIE